MKQMRLKGYNPPGRDLQSRPSHQDKVELKIARAEQIEAENNSMMQLVMDMKKEIDSLKARDATDSSKQQQGKKTSDRVLSPAVRVEPPKASLVAAAAEVEDGEEFNVRLRSSVEVAGTEEDEYEEDFANASISVRHAADAGHDHLRGRSNEPRHRSHVRTMNDWEKQQREKR